MNWFDGKKTYIGGFLMAVGVFATNVGYPEWGAALTQFGTAVSVIGIGHKLAKQ